MRKKTWSVISGPDRVEVRTETFEEARDLAIAYEQEGRTDVMVVDHSGVDQILSGTE